MHFINSNIIKYYKIELPTIKTFLFKHYWSIGKYIFEVQEISIIWQT